MPLGAAGAVRFCGGWATVPVAALVALVAPSTFVAVTLTRMVSPTSAVASVYVDPVAPAMSWKPLIGSPRCQSYVNVAPLGVHVPLPAFSVAF